MRTKLLRVVLALLPMLLALPLIASQPRAGAAKDTVVTVPGEDPAINAAIEKARKSLPEFWAAKDAPKPGESGFALKVRITDKDMVEHFWLVNVSRKDGKLSGTINNDPDMVSNVKNGQVYSFSEADISDWMFMRNGRIVGNETLRPLLERMPPDEAAEYRKMLEKP